MMMRKLNALLILLVLAGISIPRITRAQSNTSQRSTPAQDILIRNATVLTVSHGTLQNTDILIQKGKISAIGRSLKAPENIRVIDATGKFIMPGIIDCHSHSMLDAIN